MPDYSVEELASYFGSRILDDAVQLQLETRRDPGEFRSGSCLPTVRRIVADMNDRINRLSDLLDAHT